MKLGIRIGSFLPAEHPSKTNDYSSVAKYLKFQNDFLSKHLKVWVPEFSKDILETGRAGFYRGAARILDGFITTDLENVSFLEETLISK